MPTHPDSLDFRESSLSQLRELLATGAISTTDLAELCIQKTRTYQEKYLPWVNFDENLLRNQAAARQEWLKENKTPRILEGIPVAVKDTYNTVDFPTEMGSALWKGFTPGNDARVVFQAKECGAVIPGKTVTAEFAVHALNETLNPHDISRTPGTSSSGSAVAIALGIAPLALGTQTGGSIVRPASFCGVYGYKPSFGTLPRTGTLKTTDSLDTLGFFTARAEDMVTVFDALRVRGRDYPFVHRHLDGPTRQQKPKDEAWRIAFIRTHTWDDAEEYAKKSLEQWVAQAAAAGVQVDEVTLPAEFEEAHSIHAAIYNFALAYYFKEEYQSGDQVSAVMRKLIENGQSISGDAYHDALHRQERLCHEMKRILADYDALVSLSTASSAPLRDVIEKRDPSLMWTMTHLPSISAPAFTSPEGMPHGLQLAGARYRDYRLLEFVQFLVSANLLPAKPHPFL